ncbi:MAG: DUF6923 family protein [Planctomycetota bacterium JB042]
MKFVSTLVAGCALAAPLVAQDPPLYAINSGTGGQFLAELDPMTGAVTTIGSFGFVADALVVTAAGELLVADNTSHLLVSLDPATGAVVQTIGSFGVTGNIESMAIRPLDGSLWGVHTSTQSLVRIDTSTGAVTAVGTAHSIFQGMAGLTWSADGTTLFGIHCHDNRLYRIDPVTAALTPVGVTGLVCPLGLTAHPGDGRLFTVDWQTGSDMRLYTVSAVDASPTLVGTTTGGLQLEGLSFLPNAGKYGAGCAGSGGFVPVLEVAPYLPVAGTQIVVTVENGLGGAACHLFFGLNEAALPMGLGCALNVAPLFPVSIALPLGGAGPGNGQVTLPGVLPASAAGLSFTMQAFVVDPVGPLGFSNSNGFRVEVQ